MSFKQKLWSGTLTASPQLADSLSDILGETASAVTVFVVKNDQVRIEAIFEAEPNIPALTAQFAVAAMMHKNKAPKLLVKEVPPLDWLKKVAADFPPITIARWTVHGAHHRDKVPNRRYALQIDATNAFGTGEHPTTRGCLRMLEKILKKKPKFERMLDMGCGSGILAMSYAKACRKRALAVDNDPDAAEVARGNVRVNGLRQYVCTGLSRGYKSHITRRHAPYDLIISNILARPLSHMAKDLKKNVQRGGIVILSGILNHQANMVLAAHRMQGLHLIKHMKSGDWSVLALRQGNKA